MIIALSFPGNTYPIIESHTDKDCSVLGKAIISGWQSNYVLTTEKGGIEEDPLHAEEFFDEIVLNGEAQVVPLYLITLEPKKLQKMKRRKPKTASSHQVDLSDSTTHSKGKISTFISKKKKKVDEL
eukprot:TRINITY_DN3387_c0_g1_i3.p1 TRINITY_DN3387_c0_g1~~TRINITY_DN3387_c0_g1_i3.p1  ORF type:complete len:126 (+),score=9.47 TRINITY_DN3387_c0_g1_i3:216-593(+)